MATSIKISQLPAKGANLEATDLLEVSEFNGTGYVSKSITGAEIISGATTGYVPYVGATQDLELGANELYTGKLWLYDAVNDNYGSTHYTDGNYHIEDADGHKLLVIEDGFMQIHKTDTIQSNLFTSGLTVTRDHYLPNASGTIALTSDLSAYVPTTRTLTINGTTQDLSADRTFTVSTGITIGTTAITSGTVGRVLFEGTGNVVQESANLFWDNTNGRLGIGTSSPDRDFTVTKASATHGIVGLGVKNTTTSGNTYSAVFNDLNEYGNLEINGSTWPNAVTLRKVLLTSSALNGLAITIFNNSASANFSINTTVSQTERFRIVGSTGNVLINTTTDAGFKLDVNGTARLNGGTNGSIQFTGNYSQILLGTDSFYISNNANTLDIIRILNDGRVGIGTNGPVSSAILDVRSSTRGFAPPRMTTLQKNQIVSPVAGLMVYDTTLNLISVYNGTTWITL